MGAFPAQYFLPAVGHDVEFFPGQRHGEHRGSGITQGQALALIADPLAIGHLDSRCGAIPGKNDVMIPAGLTKVRQGAVICGVTVDLLQFQLLHDVQQPALAK